MTRILSAITTAIVLATFQVRADEMTCRADAPGKPERELEVWPATLPARDYLDTLWECVAVRVDQPPSPWLESQRASFANALAKQPVEVLVAPFQIQGYGLDRIERTLMTADLAYRIGAVKRVADPFLVARALGEGMRRYDRDAVLSLARQVGARTAVLGYVGHDLRHHMTVTIEVVNLDGAASATQRDWRDLPFSDADPPFAVFHRLLDEAAQAVGTDGPIRTNPGKPVAFPSRLPIPFAELAAANDGSLPASLGLTVLGAMTGSTDRLSRERIFEKALVSSLHFDGPGPGTDFLRAYALLNLEMRPAALATLGDATRPESVTLRELLNGNLPGATAALAKVEPPLQRLLLAVLVDDLRVMYGKTDEPTIADAAATFGDDAADWQYLVETRSTDNDPWRVERAAAIKVLLDAVFPVAGLDARSLIQGTNVLGSSVDDVAIDLANVRHVGRFADTAEPDPCCTAANAGPSAWDVVWMLEGRSESRISESLSLTLELRGSTETAGQALARYDELLNGHPMIAAYRASYLLEIADKASGNRETWVRQAEPHARLAAWWSPGQNMIAYRGLLALAAQTGASLPYFDPYGHDYPKRPDFPQSFYSTPGELAIALFREADNHSRTNLIPLSSLMRLGDDLPWIEQQLQARFIGHPARLSLTATIDMRLHPDADPRDTWRKTLEAEPENWNARLKLGTELLVKDGNHDEAARVWLAHPRFHEESPPSRVEVSNDAYSVGSTLYWQGRYDLAAPFYEVAAGLRTGSDASMASAIRLNILAENYLPATEESLERALRYPSAYAYRDYLSFLHALGHGEDAWDGFLQTAAAFENPQVWVSALVGHRMEGKSEPEIRAWLKQPGIRGLKFRTTRLALTYAVLVNSTDRMPPPDLGKLVAELEGPPEAHVDDLWTIARPAPTDPSKDTTVSSSRLRDESRARLPVGAAVPTELVYFATAYAALKHRDYDAAVDAFETMAQYYPLEGTDLTYTLPYFAMAAAKAGDATRLEAYLTANASSVTFDPQLARALLAGARKDASLAASLLSAAFRVHPNTDSRPVLVEYQYAEACEWLFEETGDSRFVDMLLDWVVKHQVIQPMHGWAYSMEYTYARTEERRKRALAMTMYLDPASDRIKSATQEERERAQAWGDANNPFLHQEADVALPSTAAVSPARATGTAG